MDKIYTTLDINVYCKKLIEYKSLEELQSLLPMIKGEKYIQIGGGSNILFRKDYDGYILHSKISTIEILDNNILKVGSGIKVDEYVDFCVKNDLNNVCLQQLYGIPAEIGGIIVNNAGLWNKGIEPIVDHIECINLESGELKLFDVSECEYSYRNSKFKDIHNNKWCVLYAYLKHNKEKVNEKHLQRILENRERNYLPTSKGKSIGCIWNCVLFDENNKIKNNTLSLIRELNLSNLKLNDAVVFEKFPCIIQNINNCSGEDVYQLSQKIMKIIKEQKDIDLKYEIEIV